MNKHHLSGFTFSIKTRATTAFALVMLLLGLAFVSPAVAEISVFNNGNDGGVYSNPSAATTFTVASPVTLTYFMTYHWNGGSGSPVGTLALKHADGTLYGPWQAVSVTGNNIYWEVNPATTIKVGNYTVVDSHPASWAWNSLSGNAGMAVIRGNPASTTAATEQVSLAELAAMVPEFVVADGGYLVKHNFDPLGLTGIDLTGYVTTLVGDRLRLENLVLGERAYWLDFSLKTSPRIAFVPTTAFTAGVPNTSLSGTLAGVDTASTAAFLYGPPLRLALTPMGINGQYYTVYFAFDSAGEFAYASVEPTTAPSLAIGVRAIGAADPVAAWIASMSRVDATLPSDAAVGAALLECGQALISNVRFPPALATTANNVMKKMAANSPMLLQIKSALAAGDIGTASTLTASFLTTGLIESQTSKTELSNLSKALGVAANASGATCVDDYKGALEIAIKGALKSKFPVASCGLNLMAQAAKLTIAYVNDGRVTKVFEHWRGATLKDDWASYSVLPEVNSLILTLAQKNHNSPGSTAESRFAAASKTLHDMLVAWDTQSTTGGIRANQLARVKALYDGIGEQKQRLLAQVGETGTADEKAVRAFVRYDQQLQKARSQLAPFRLGVISDQQLDQAAADAVSYLNNGDQVGYRNAIASQIAIWNSNTGLTRATTRASTLAGVTGMDVPAYCSPTATAGTGSGEVQEGISHLSFTVSGVTDFKLISTSGYPVRKYTYSGKLAGSTLTFMGSAWGDRPATGPNDTITSSPWVLKSGLAVAGIPAGNGYDLFDTDGALPSRHFSYSVPIPSDSTSATLSASLETLFIERSGVSITMNLTR